MEISIKQILLIIGLLVIIIVGSGFITNRKPKDSFTNEQLENKKQADITRLFKADTHLQRVTTPVSVLRQEALEKA